MSADSDLALEHCSKQTPTAQFGPGHVFSPARTRPSTRPARRGSSAWAAEGSWASTSPLSTPRLRTVSPAAAAPPVPRRIRELWVPQPFSSSRMRLDANRHRIDLRAGEAVFPSPDLYSPFGVG